MENLNIRYLSNSEARDIKISNTIHTSLLSSICKRDISSKIVIIPIYYGIDCQATLVKQKKWEIRH